MKTIWIDGYEANVTQRLGSGQIGWQLLKNIQQLDHKNKYTILLPEPPLEDMPPETENFKYKVLKPKRLWTRFALPIYLFATKNKPDVFFSPTHYGPVIVPSGVKRVITIFDLAFLHFPEMFKKTDLYKLENWTKDSLKKSNHIITISNYSKNDLNTYFKTDKTKITVAYPGYGQEIYFPIKNHAQIAEVIQKYSITGSYVLFIGTVQPRKNLMRLIEAVARIDDLKLVVVGKISSGGGRGAWMSDETLQKPKELGIEDRVIFTGFVPDADIGGLMNGAVVFAFPSLYEGFGIPVIDAFAAGTPVVATNVSSVPEIVGDAALLIDPKSVDEIEQAIRLIVSDKRLSNKLTKKGLEQAKKFSWKKMAREVIKVLENV